MFHFWSYYKFILLSTPTIREIQAVSSTDGTLCQRAYRFSCDTELTQSFESSYMSIYAFVIADHGINNSGNNGCNEGTF